MEYIKSLNPIILKGETLTKILIDVSGGDHRIDIWTKNHKHFQFYHYQDCCESVTIYKIIGSLNSILNNPLTEVSEKIVKPSDGEKQSKKYNGDSWTETTYTFKTQWSEAVKIVWFGESNGYYSESVDFCEVK